MVILRQERVFSYAGKGKFSECWMIIVYDTSGPSIHLYKDPSAKKAIYDRLHVPSMASQMRFGTTCRPYGNLPDIKVDPKIDSSCMLAFQVERKVKKTVQPQILWLCCESTKQMFGIMKILACGLTIMNFPAPPKNTNPNDINALHHYRPRILQPSNSWEEFWDNPPDAKLISPAELTKHFTQSMDALNAAVAQQHEVQPPVIETIQKSQSTPAFGTPTRRRQSIASQSSSSTTSSRSLVSRSLSGRRRSSKKPIRIWQTSYTQDMPKIPYSPQKSRKYERQESARSSPIVIRQLATQQKRFSAPEPPYEEDESIPVKETVDTYQVYQPAESQQLVKTAPPPSTPPPLFSQIASKIQKPFVQEIHHYDQPPDEDDNLHFCYCDHPAQPPVEKVIYQLLPSEKHIYEQPPIEKHLYQQPPVEDPPQSDLHFCYCDHSTHTQPPVEKVLYQQAPVEKVLYQPPPIEKALYQQAPDEEDLPKPEEHINVCYCDHQSHKHSHPHNHHHHKHSHSQHSPHHHHHHTHPRRHSSVGVASSTPPQSILKRQLSKQRTAEEESPPQAKRPVSGYSSSAYGSGRVTPTHLIEEKPVEFDVQLLRRMSELSLRPLSRTYASQQTTPHHHHHHHHHHEKPITPPHQEHHYHEICHTPPYEQEQPLIEYKPVDEPKTMSLLEQSAIPIEKERRISDPEFLVKPQVKRRSKSKKIYISQGAQTDHELPDPPISLIENFEFQPTKRFTLESHEPYLSHYQKLNHSHQSLRSIYIQHFDETNEYETVRPFFRASSSSCASSCSSNECEVKSPKHSDPVLINDSLGTRTYTIEVEESNGLL